MMCISQESTFPATGSLPVLGLWKKGDTFEPTESLKPYWDSTLVRSLRERGALPNDKGEILYQAPSEMWPEGVALVQLGDPACNTPNSIGRIVCNTLKKLRWARCVSFAATDWFMGNRITAARLFAQNVTLAATPKTTWKKDVTSDSFPEVGWLSTAEEKFSVDKALSDGVKIGESLAFAMRLADTPSNICTPSFLAEEARELARHIPNVTVSVLEEEALEAAGMGGILSVAKGSVERPVLIELCYSGAKKDIAPIVLVGKGITFDAGGISLKPAAKMGDMIYDMSGAASVMATLRAAAELALPLNLVALVPACENLPSGQAMKPGDVLTTYSGRTVEVQNTDAEGRLILADALTKALEHHPQCVIDVATLTGACVVALGSTYTGLFSNQETLSNELLAAGREVGDLAWPMPLHPDYTALMQSTYADLVNVSPERGAGASTAAAFLEVFVEKTPWAHLDIAGTSNTSGKDHASTGRPVSLLVEFLRRQSVLAQGTSV